MSQTASRSTRLPALATDLAACAAGVGLVAWLDALRLGLGASPRPDLAEVAALVLTEGTWLLAPILLTAVIAHAVRALRSALAAGDRPRPAGSPSMAAAVLTGWAAALAFLASSGFSLKIGWPAGAALLGAGVGWLTHRLESRRTAPRGGWMLLAGAALFWAAALVLARLPARGAEAGPAASADTPPSFVLVVIDALRADHVGIYGHDRETSPSIDRLARGGVLFTRAAAPSSWTPPSMASFLTSSTVGQHGLVEKGQGLPPDADLLAARLGAAGYRTAAFTTNPWLKEVFGFDRGFETYLDIDRLGLERRLLGVRLKNWALRRAGRIRVEPELVPGAPEVTRRALEWIGRNGSRPFFLYLHYMDVHSPYDAAAPFHGAFCTGHDFDLPDHLLEVQFRRGRFRDDPAVLDHVLELYDEEILATDAAIGRLIEGLSGLGLDDSVHLILTADHGEEFLDHGGVMHGQTLYEEVVHVPLILKLAGRDARPPRVVGDQVSTLDVYPTILDLAGLAPREGAAGLSLVPWLMDGSAPPAPRVVGSQLFRKGHASTALYLEGDKFIRRQRLAGEAAASATASEEDRTTLELFRLGVDPHERMNLAGMESDAAGAFLGLVESYETIWGVPGVGGARSLETLDPETLEQLRALGYVD